MVQRRKQKTRKGTRSYRKKATRARRRQARKTRVRKLRGGAAHIPDDRFPVDVEKKEVTVVDVIDADGDGAGPVAVDLEVAKKELIAASDRPADPYDVDTPGDEPE